MKKSLLILSLLALSIAFTGIAYAATTTAAIQVQATVVAACTVSTANINFGNVTGLATVASNGSITVNCGSGTPYHVAIDMGGHYVFGRNLSYQGTSITPYYLYKDAALSAQWGDNDFANTYPTGASVAGTGTGAAQVLTVYGKLSTFSGLPVGSYGDTVVVTVNY